MSEPLTVEEMVEQASAEFDELCQERHKMGAERYGPVKFLAADNDMFQMLREELIDAANYARYTFIRLTLLEAALGAELATLAIKAVEKQETQESALFPENWKGMAQ